MPGTLLVADYILSLDICIERKSLSDLLSSLISGRLHKQLEFMLRHYKRPVLLIEFSEDKPFCLQSQAAVARDSQTTGVIAKIVLLTKHFPTVRIIWSRSYRHTASLFLMLKRNQLEPDVNAALSAGANDGVASGAVGAGEYGEDTSPGGGTTGGIGNGTSGTTSHVHSMVPYDMLKKIPGVTDDNVSVLLKKVRTLADLSEQSLDTLTQWLGRVNANKIHRFLHTSHAAAMSNYI